MSGESYMESDFYKDSDYTADISTKMRVPDRLTAHGGVPGVVMHFMAKGRCPKKRFYLRLCPKLWVGGGSKSQTF